MASQTPPNMADIFNRINMSISKQSKLLSASKPPPTTTAITPPTTKGKSFSSLAAKPTIQSQSQSQPQNSNPDADLKSTYLLPPNAGVGFAPTPSQSSATAEQRALRERLGKVGWKGGKKGERDGGKGKKRAAEESESEEELGRSAVGKSTGKGKRVKSEDEDVKVVSGAVESRIGGGEKEVEGVEVSAPVKEVKEDLEMETVADDTPAPISEGTQNPIGEGKPKKKKKKTPRQRRRMKAQRASRA
ncbi:hypothetical protein QBC34DRAFT_390530 [Podospora aff. communis PSN243]|uniref:Uncharacterized protein n=1 Tax=Podospora aff. communis PSN243 TaxID=3040156 RepID=A0AAV9H6Z5_9PEZI|nr:hypothetical protein QBC34DRAFT_390530 [Podospora aff. communis PSN243]